MSKTIRQVCDREYRAAVRAIRPPLARESAGRSVTAPPVVVQGRGTRNKLVWLQLRFELEDMAGKP